MKEKFLKNDKPKKLYKKCVLKKIKKFFSETKSIEYFFIINIESNIQKTTLKGKLK